MSYTTITAHITDQTIQLTNLPHLASGSVGVLQIQCHFCELWDGYGKSAVFYKDEKHVCHVSLKDDVVTVPHEVLAEAGFFYFGIMGMATNTRTTEVLRISVAQGAITSASMETEAPTPDIYGQILATMALYQARLNKVVGMQASGGSRTTALSAEYVSGTIHSNGAHACIEFDITGGLTLVAGGYHHTDFCIPPELAPLVLTEINCSMNGIEVVVETDDEESPEGWARIRIYNNTGSYASVSAMCKGYYPLASVFISELADVRVGLDGHEYDTAGEAVRNQISELIGYTGGEPVAPSPEVYAQLLANYNELSEKMQGVTAPELSDIVGLPEALAGKAPSGHNHDSVYANFVPKTTKGSCDDILVPLAMRDIRTDNDELFNLFEDENYAYVYTVFDSNLGLNISRMQIAVGFTSGYVATRTYYSYGNRGWSPWNLMQSSILHPHFYGNTMPTTGTKGRIFYLIQ